MRILSSFSSSRNSKLLILGLFCFAFLRVSVWQAHAQTATLTTLHSFRQAPEGNLAGGLLKGSDGNFYGNAYMGGSHNKGAVYSVTPAGILTVLYSFNGTDGSGAGGPLNQGNDGNYYGITLQGGAAYDGTDYSGYGTIFKMTPSGTLTVLHSFSGNDGEYPSSGLTLGSDGNFYGTAAESSLTGNGTIYKITPSGVFTVLHSFIGTDGSIPDAGVILGADGNFYGTTANGGAGYNGTRYTGNGTIFKITPAGVLTTLYSFNGTGSDGIHPQVALLEGSDGNFYGAALLGGIGYDGTSLSGYGTLFKVTPLGAFTVLHSFNGADGAHSASALVEWSDGNYYGMTRNGGVGWDGTGYTGGTIFKITPGGSLTTLHGLSGDEGSQPNGDMALGNDGSFYGVAGTGGSGVNGTIFRVTQAGLFTMIHTFSGDEGASPTALIQGVDGDYYGTAKRDGRDLFGTAFRIAPTGDFVTLHSFASVDGNTPGAGLIQSGDGNFYGTTIYGGVGSIHSTNDGPGAIFKMTPAGSITVLDTFDGTHGWHPYAAVVHGTDGNYYGTTAYGGIGFNGTFDSGKGTVFKTTQDGTLTVLYSFSGSDGSTPKAALIQGSDGNFYGTTYDGGANNYGTVFKITPLGVLTVLHSFNGNDGAAPQAGLIVGADGNFYGTTALGGQAFTGLNPFGVPTGYGTIFKITPQGSITVVHLFTGIDGANPQAGLILGGDGNFYGTAGTGGASYSGPDVNGSPTGYGAIFQLTPLGALSVLYSFNNIDGRLPAAELVLGSDGYFYGTTSYGGSAGLGTVFRLALTPLQVLTTISISPPTASIHPGATQQFSATAKDQNGSPMSTPPAFTWTVSGGGVINASGLFTAGAVAGGPFTVTATSGSISGTASVTVTALSNADFNGDGKSDLVLQNAASNKVALWYLNGPALIGGGYLSTTPPAGWRVVAEGDFNGDGKPDLVMQSSSTNQVAVWALYGTVVTGGTYISATPAAGWSVVGVGDFNGDGKPDLILQNAASNKVAIWNMNGTTLAGGGYLSATPPAGWRVVGAGDFNGDGKADLVLQDSATRKIAAWYLNGMAVLGGSYLSATPPVNWKAVGVADYNGDGKPDIVLQNQSTNQVALWYMNGVTLTTGQYISSTPTAGWSVVGPR